MGRRRRGRREGAALAIGPGLGRTPEAKRLRDELLALGDHPLVLDADGLHELAPGAWGARAVLTPHAGELARLLGEESAWVARTGSRPRGAAPRRSARSACSRAPTRSSPPRARGRSIRVNRAPGLATAGTGDVLTGIIAAFLAKGLEPQLAAAGRRDGARPRGAQLGRQVGLTAW